MAKVLHLARVQHLVGVEVLHLAVSVLHLVAASLDLHLLLAVEHHLVGWMNPHLQVLELHLVACLHLLLTVLHVVADVALHMLITEALALHLSVGVVLHHVPAVMHLVNPLLVSVEVLHLADPLLVAEVLHLLIFMLIRVVIYLADPLLGFVAMHLLTPLLMSKYIRIFTGYCYGGCIGCIL